MLAGLWGSLTPGKRAGMWRNSPPYCASPMPKSLCRCGSDSPPHSSLGLLPLGVFLCFLLQEMPSVSVLDYALPQRPPQAREEERDPSERALPRRSSSPVIGSPPVRAVPIGTPPKQAAVPSFNQQVPPRGPVPAAGCCVRSQQPKRVVSLLLDPVPEASAHPGQHAAALPRSLRREDVPQPALQRTGTGTPLAPPRCRSKHPGCLAVPGL